MPRAIYSGKIELRPFGVEHAYVFLGTGCPLAADLSGRAADRVATAPVVATVRVHGRPLKRFSGLLRAEVQVRSAPFAAPDVTEVLLIGEVDLLKGLRHYEGRECRLEVSWR